MDHASGLASGYASHRGTKLTLKCKRIKDGEALIIATNTEDPRRAFNMYRRRWGIECLFADEKTRGLNLEGTHVTNTEKLSMILCLVTLAIV